ncbi:hypothetical protein VP01_2824g1 [Puccinia sorghi]|uniref:Uncharacterized protein n=1 Tax=Puccinia sorghi TaxID=27349 RepID=A0A0L6V320_9BASI|nr:hypothetical protein VP01_2824g1 [Puccinia sorghi]
MYSCIFSWQNSSCISSLENSMAETSSMRKATDTAITEKIAGFFFACTDYQAVELKIVNISRPFCGSRCYISPPTLGLDQVAWVYIGRGKGVWKGGSNSAYYFRHEPYVHPMAEEVLLSVGKEKKNTGLPPAQVVRSGLYRSARRCRDACAALSLSLWASFHSWSIRQEKARHHNPLCIDVNSTQRAPLLSGFSPSFCAAFWARIPSSNSTGSHAGYLPTDHKDHEPDLGRVTRTCTKRFGENSPPPCVGHYHYHYHFFSFFFVFFFFDLFDIINSRLEEEAQDLTVMRSTTTHRQQTYRTIYIYNSEHGATLFLVLVFWWWEESERDKSRKCEGRA